MDKPNAFKTSVPDKNPEEKAKGLGGWLAFFIFSLAMTALLTLGYGIFGIYTSLQDPYVTGGTLAYLVGLDVVNTIVMVGFIVYTIIALLTIKPNAIALAKMTLVMLFVSNALFIGFDAMAGVESMDGYQNSIQSLLYCVIWFVFLFTSKRVKNTYVERTVYMRDWIFFAIMMGIPIVVYFLSMSSIYESTSYSIDRELAVGEYTDGKVAFMKPEGAELNKEDYGHIPIHTMTKGQMSISVMSDLCKSERQTCFDEIVGGVVVGMREESMITITELNIKNTVINGYPLMTQPILIETAEGLMMDITLMFDTQTEKITLIMYSTPGMEKIDNDRIYEEFLSTIKFS